MDSREMMEQASKTAHEYLTAAIKTVDEEFGEGAHQKYPEIVASLVQASATDFLTSVIRNEVVAHLDLIPDALGDIRDSLK